MKIVVKVLLASTMLGAARGTRAALTIVADATEVMVSHISEKNIGT
jgi:hypothetical protein